MEQSCYDVFCRPALFQDARKKQSWKPRLKLAMELNKTDFVLEGILADSPWTVNTSNKIIYEFMQSLVTIYFKALVICRYVYTCASYI